MELPKLKSGDKIGILAPARKVSNKELQPFIKWCNDNSWDVILPKNIFEENNQFAGTDQQKIDDFNSLLSNPEIKAIFCARGGYGSARIIDKINWNLLLENPKWICGYSDITAINQHLINHYQIPSLHCLMPLSFIQYDDSDFLKSANLTAEILRNGILEYELPESFSNVEIENKIITGGNLSVLYSLMGSNSLGKNYDRIIFVEDLDEYLYHVDRMVNSLKRANFFKGASMIISGGLSDMHDNTIPFGKTADEIIQEHADSLNIPYIRNFPCGHISKNLPIPVGFRVSIKNNRITFVPN